MERALRQTPWAARGEFTAMEGRVWSDFNREIHVIPPREIPAEWPRYESIDPGTRNPCAILRAALDPADDTLYLVGEYYERERSATQHAAAIHAMREGTPEPEFTVCDPEDKGFRYTLAEQGIPTRQARKEVRMGISAVADRLRLDANGRPHVVIFSTLRNTIREVEGYCWAPSIGKADAKEAPLKRDDHLCDALRYLCVALKRDAEMGAS